MQLFVSYQVHEYMDMYPVTQCRTFSGNSFEEIENAGKQFCQHMNQNYSGGTTTFIKVLNADEAWEFIMEELNKALQYRNSLDSADKEWLQSVINLFNQCY